ncbi:MAG: hypothetical protein IJ272_01375 [Clostridia bacterium]|nr:hypothetical protein [Clostridia bacterium]
MENKNISKIVEGAGFIKGGTYEAYLKAREVVLNSFDGGDKLICLNSQVKIPEFMEAVKILMTFASKHPDEYVELYDCDMSCKRFKHRPCPGDCILSDRATKRCPFYEE